MIQSVNTSIEKTISNVGELPASPAVVSTLTSLTSDLDAGENDVNLKLEKFSNLQSMPQVIVKIKQITEGPNSSAADLANCILSDHQLTSRVLRMANSAHYGSFAGKINTVTRAIILIGSRAIRNIAISMGVFQLVNDISKGSDFNLTSFWTRSLGCGIIAKYLAHRINKHKLIESAFIGGFMHDIGQVILAGIYGDKYKEVCKAEGGSDSLDICKTERIILGTDHTKAGEYVARKWNLPSSLIRIIADHHHENSEKRRFRKSDELLVDMVYLSDRLYPHVMAASLFLSEANDDIVELSRKMIGISEVDMMELPLVCRKQITEIAHDLEVDIESEFNKKEILEKDVIEIRQQLNSKEIQLAFLQNATEALMEAKSNDEILQVICEAVFRGLQMGRVIIFEYDKKRDSFTGRVGFGLESQHAVRALSFNAANGLFRHLRETGEVTSIVDENHEVYGTLITPDEMSRLEPQAFAAIPIRILDEVRYVLFIDNHNRKVPISDEAIRSMTSLTNQGALSLERSLYKTRIKNQQVC